ncbi:MAG TPA: Gfo/Idh/MocA family oxidoreductase [Polyangiaceae bacterium]|nr:Gfo/Idh/MocA family oxidoreductase [Polyangiaceae bacterium]
MTRRPRVGFLGLGWIGHARLKVLAEADLVDIPVLADGNPQALKAARLLAPEARAVASLEELLAHDLDAVVIATPSGLHAAACKRALESGLAVFCQKPLAPNASEVASVIEAARAADRLLRVDFCYRHARAVAALREAVSSGSIGRVYAAELTFHNAYGPDKAWARERELSGGGCLIDLGVHLVDTAFWVLDRASAVKYARARLYAGGKPVKSGSSTVEDFALGQLELEDGTALDIGCSWQSSFGDHARIRIALYGSAGGAIVENVNGSFFEFSCERFHGTAREVLFRGDDAWGGRALVSFAEELIVSHAFRADEQLLRVARALDRLYAPGPLKPAITSSTSRALP